MKIIINYNSWIKEIKTYSVCTYMDNDCFSRNKFYTYICDISICYIHREDEK